MQAMPEGKFHFACPTLGKPTCPCHLNYQHELQFTTCPCLDGQVMHHNFKGFSDLPAVFL
jgi:hypothetical protein